jgi:hypothetical protein
LTASLVPSAVANDPIERNDDAGAGLGHRAGQQRQPIPSAGGIAGRSEGRRERAFTQPLQTTLVSLSFASLPRPCLSLVAAAPAAGRSLALATLWRT